MPDTRPLDFSAFGETESVPLNRIEKFAVQALTHSWTTIPHVTHHDEADITALEATREKLNAQNPQTKVSALAFILKAAALTLKAHPKLNASFDAATSCAILKKYYNLGIAIDAPSGLLVGVIRGCDQKSIQDIAAEIVRLSRKAREKGLSIQEMSGGSFTVSSLGGIGGTAFTPIINAPEAAILGISKAQWKPLRGANDQLEWRLMLPLSLSYDHRVINGADAARFVRALAEVLAEPAAML